MNGKRIWSYLASPYYLMRPLEARFRSREAFIRYMRAKGLNGDGTPLKASNAVKGP